MGQALSKGPCACGSSDGLALYDNGWSHCFVCDVNIPPAVDGVRKDHMTSDMLVGEYQDLGRRRIKESTCRKYSYRVAQYAGKNVQVADYFDKDGVRVAQKIRLPGKEFAWTGDAKKATLFGAQLWKSDPKLSVVVTEGEIDALAFAQVQDLTWPVVSIPNGAQSAVKSVKANLSYLLGFKEVVLAFDNDEPGQKAALECAELFPPGKCRIAKFELKDAGEYVEKGRDKDLLKAFWNAPTYRPDGVIDSQAAWDKMIAEREMEKALGRIPFRQPILQESWRGRRMGGVYTYCAGTGTGKSTEFREDAVFVMGLGHKVGYVALEETVGQTLLSWLCILANKPEDEITNEEMAEVFKKIEGKFFLYDHHSQRDVEGLINKLRYMVVAEGCRILYVDHLTGVIVAGENDDERISIDRFMKNSAALAVELKVPIMLISHLSRRDKTNHEEGDQVSLKDLRGSHAISQYSTGVVALERNQQESEGEVDVSVVRRLKHRWRGRLGAADTMHYHHKTGRYLPKTPDVTPEVTPEVHVVNKDTGEIRAEQGGYALGEAEDLIEMGAGF